MGNAQSSTVNSPRSCGTPRCGPIPIRRKKEHHNILLSARSLEEEQFQLQPPPRTTIQQQQGGESKEEEEKTNDNASGSVINDDDDRRSSASQYVIKTIKTTIRDLLNPPEPERLPPKRHAPKQMLYGCESADEHYERIDELCTKVANLHGLEGLEAMGFDFRVVHHDQKCTCPGGGGNNRQVNNNNGSNDDDDLTDSEADPDEMRDEGYMEGSEDGDDDDDDYGQFGYDDDDDEGEEQKEGLNESFLVPLKIPETKEEEEEKKLDTISSPTPTAGNLGNSSSNNHYYQTPYSFSRKDSAISLFSLATHNTDFSYPTTTTSRSVGSGDDQSRRQRRNNRTPTPQRKKTANRFPLASISSAPNIAVMEQDSCAVRLHHTETGTIITPENHSEFVADGKFYDELARLCMEYSQQVMMEGANLEWVTVSGGDDSDANTPPKKFGAIASKSYFEKRRIPSSNKRRTLLVVTGKGQVQAGIFSRRHLLVTSMEAATALPFIREAQERDMDIVILDPNALGYRNGMDVVEKSLEYFFLSAREEAGKSKCIALDDNEEIYVLAHSMAGAQIVRFFISNSSCHHNNNNSGRPPTTPPPPSPSTSSNGETTTINGSSTNNDTATTTSAAAVDKTALRSNLLERIKGFALTDSNHNINWIKKDQHPQVMQALTGPRSLYIKSHKVHEKAKELGEAHHDCQFWRHRFGDVRTLWAGTHEHALTNYTARAHIWEHFEEQQFFAKKEPKAEPAPASSHQLPPRCPPR